MAKREPGATLPVVRVEGTHADLGRAMGRAQAAHIRAAVDAVYKQLREQKIRRAQLREQIAPFVDATERIFPQYLVELREMARAAEVPFEPLFRLNCYESRPPGTPPPGVSRAAIDQLRAAGPTPASRALAEAAPTKDPGTTAAGNGIVRSRRARRAPEPVPAADGCTSVLGVGPDCIVAGHTEDSWPQAVEGLYILDATVTERNAFTGTTGSRFVAMDYAQTLPGCSAAVNDRGLIVLIDALPDPERNVGAPRHFVSRALLDVPDIDAALDLLRTTNRGGGWNYVLVQGRRAVNAETTATQVVATEITAGTYAHTNHYLAPALAKATSEPRPSSFARLTRATELVRAGMDVAAMKLLLSDRQGAPDSICRDRTIGAFVADTAARQIEVCWGEPEDATWTRYTY